MFEYIFSHKTLAAEFCESLDELAIPYTAKDDELGFIVSTPEDLDDDLIDQIEVCYDQLMEQSERLLDAESGVVGKHVSAITVNLSDGRIAQVPVRPELMNKLMSVLSFAELNELVEAITDGVERPDDRPACQR
jgi:hypothetical protein